MSALLTTEGAARPTDPPDRGSHGGAAVIDPPAWDPHEAVRQCLVRDARLFFLQAYHGVCKAHLAADDITRRDLAEELFQELALQGLRCAERLLPGHSPRSWLFGVLANLCKQRRTKIYKQIRRSVPLPSSAEEDGAFFDQVMAQVAAQVGARDPEEVLGAAQRSTELLAPLSEAAREIITLMKLEDLTDEEAGARLGIQPNAARQRLHRALKDLRAHRGGESR